MRTHCANSSPCFTSMLSAQALSPLRQRLVCRQAGAEKVCREGAGGCHGTSGRPVVDAIAGLRREGTPTSARKVRRAGSTGKALRAGLRATAGSGAWTAQAGAGDSQGVFRSGRLAWHAPSAVALGRPRFSARRGRIAGAYGWLQGPLAKAIPARGVAQFAGCNAPMARDNQTPTARASAFLAPLCSATSVALHLAQVALLPPVLFCAVAYHAPFPANYSISPWWTLPGQPIDAFACFLNLPLACLPD
jgi:hypothetical protein